MSCRGLASIRKIEQTCHGGGKLKESMLLSSLSERCLLSEESALGLFECTDEIFLQGMKTEMSDSIGSKRTRAESRSYNGSACETVKKRDFGN